MRHLHNTGPKSVRYCGRFCVRRPISRARWTICYTAGPRPPKSLAAAIVGEIKLAGTDTHPYTYTVWGEGIDYLLTAADYTTFAGTDADNNTVPTCTVPLTAALEITGLTPIPAMSPIRFEARFWPDDTMLTQLKQASVAQWIS